MTSFRLATISDYWKAANKKNLPIKIEKIIFNDCLILSNLEFSLGNGIQAFCGKNGIGKSSIVRTIYNTLVNEENICGRGRFDNCHINIKYPRVTVKDGDQVLDIDFQDDFQENNIDVAVFDPCYIVPVMLKFLHGLSDLDEILPSHGSHLYDVERLSRINYLTNNIYSSVRCVEIEDSFSGFLITKIPFFEVRTVDGVEYNSLNMGMGEFSLFYFDWIVQQLINSDQRLLLVEEPESFLPPNIQKKLMDVIAYIVSKSSVQVLIFSHSENILSKISRNNIKVLRRIGRELRCFPADTNFDSLQVLGLDAQKNGIILCEDIAAISFTKNLVSLSSKYVKDNFYYYIAGSNGDIEKLLKDLPRMVDGFKIIGMFDGDCRGRNKDKYIDKCFVYLPGNTAPEVLLVPHFNSLDLEQKVSLFSNTEERVSLALEKIQGMEFHDYLNEFFLFLSIDIEQGFNILIGDYLKIHKEERAIKTCIKDINFI